MGGLSLAHWAIVALVAILLLGGGRFSRMAVDIAKGLKSFKKELGEDKEAAANRPAMGSAEETARVQINHH